VAGFVDASSRTRGEDSGPAARGVQAREAIAKRARELGFDAIGVARADEPLGVEYERYRTFVDAGLHGTMRYLASDVEARRRLDGEAILPGAKSVICLARRYARGAEREALDPPVACLVARYARGHDYHNQLRKKLRQLAKLVRTLGEGVEARPLLDEEPVLERAWAARAGLGFVGKHGLVIVPGQGSYVLLGEVVTTLELPADAPIAERCGSCTRCLDACPTSAFTKPFVLDPRRCVAYFTIEEHGPVDASLERAAGERLFGCDDCQSACPFNRTAPAPPEATRMFEPQSVWRGVTLASIVALDEEGFRRLTTGSPVHRATRAGLAKNAVRVAASILRRGALGPEHDDARLAVAAARSHDAAIVREAAARVDREDLA
jgi:epoxyqueuosine reductase